MSSTRVMTSEVVAAKPVTTAATGATTFGTAATTFGTAAPAVGADSTTPATGSTTLVTGSTTVATGSIGETTAPESFSSAVSVLPAGSTVELSARVEGRRPGVRPEPSVLMTS